MAGSSSKSKFDYQAVPGDYQQRAMQSGPVLQRFWHAGKLAAIDRWVAVHLTPQDTALEIGCGSGNLLRRAGRSGARLLALDISKGALEFVQQELGHERPGQERWETFLCTRAVGEYLPLETGSLDWVLLSEVIEHLDQPHLVLDEARRVLKPGGRLFLTTPNYRSFWPVLETAVDKLGRAPKMAGEQHVSRFSANSLRALLDARGWKIDLFSSYYRRSPFLAIISRRWAERVLESELRRPSHRRMLLAVVAHKP